MTDTQSTSSTALGSATLILGPAVLWLMALAVTLFFGEVRGCSPTEAATAACFILGFDIRQPLVFVALFTAFAWILILPWTLATSIMWLYRRYQQSRPENVQD